MARSLPAEFTADVLIRVAAASALRNHPRRKELLEDAFVLAAHAREKFPRRTLPAVDPNSADYVLGRAAQLGLDTLTLQTRVIEALGDARLLEQLPAPPSGPFTCEDTLLWDSTPYWRLLGKWKVFPPRAVVSLVEVVPAIEMIRSMAPDKEQLENLTNWLLDGLSRLPQDDRAFTASVPRLAGSMEQLAILRTQQGLRSRPLIAAIASTLTRHLSGTRCKDALGMTRSAEAGVVWDYNQRMRSAPHLVEEELPEIRSEDTQAGTLLDRSLIGEDAPWRDVYFELADGKDRDAILQSKLYEWQPAVWMLLAKPFIGTEARHPVMVTYTKLELLFAGAGAK